MLMMTLIAQTFAYQSVPCALIQCSGTIILGTASFVITHMNKALKKQDQATDSKPIGYLIWETGGGWWEFVEEEPVEYYDYKPVYAQPVVKKPMDGDAIHEGFEATGLEGINFTFRAFVEGVRWAEEYHGIGGEDD